MPTRPFSAIPAYYTPFSTQPPTRPSLYCCRLVSGCYTHLTWKCGSFWDGDNEAEVSHWVELPEFISAALPHTARP